MADGDQAPKRRRSPSRRRAPAERSSRPPGPPGGRARARAPGQGPSGGGGRFGGPATLLGLLVLAAVVAALGWVFVVFPSQRNPGAGKAVEIVVAPDPTPAALADALATAGLVAHPRAFTLWVRATGGTGSVVPGKHLLTDDVSAQELMAR